MNSKTFFNKLIEAGIEPTEIDGYIGISGSKLHDLFHEILNLIDRELSLYSYTVEDLLDILKMSEVEEAYYGPQLKTNKKWTKECTKIFNKLNLGFIEGE